LTAPIEVIEIRLAIHGGEPVRRKKFPTVSDASGRNIGEEELKELGEVIMSGKLNRVYGDKVKKFEQEFAGLFGVKHAIASTSGTAAIHVALGAIGVSPGDEVITSPISDMGTIIPVLFQGAIPVFSDLRRDHLTLNPDDLKKRITDKTYAIVPVHLFGMPADMDPIMEIAEEKGLYVIEDCAQAYLAEYKGRYVGTIGDMGAFSLQQSKHMTTGDGGMTITNNDELADYARLFADKGWDRSKGRRYVMLGMNYRMTELQGAVGLAQIKKVKWVVERRRKLADRLNNELADLADVLHLPIPPKNVKHSYWQYPILVNIEKLKISISDFSAALRAEGIPNSAGYIGEPLYLKTPLIDKKTFRRSAFPLMNPFNTREVSYYKGLCPDTEWILERLIVIPWNEYYTEDDVDDIAEAITKVVKYYLES